MGVGRNSITREKAVKNGVYSVESQTREFFLHRILAPPPYLGQDYEQNGFGEKRGMVKLNRLSGHKMVESYGARVGKAEISRGFQKERESAGVERTRISRGFRKQRRIVAPAVRFLGCLTVTGSQNSIFVQQCRLVLPSPLVLPFHIAVASLLVSANLLQASHSQAETRMRGERVRRKIASREGRASSVVARRPLSGSLSCLREMGRFAFAPFY